MDWLLGLLPAGGTLAAAGAAIVGGLLWLWNMRRRARNEGRREVEQQQKEAADEARQRMLEADVPRNRRDSVDRLRDPDRRV